MPTWYKMMHKFSHDHNSEHDRLGTVAWHIEGLSPCNYVNVVIKIQNSISNCRVITVVSYERNIEHDG